MKLDWLGEYRLLMEKIIKYANTYARTYRKKMSYGTDILISAAVKGCWKNTILLIIRRMLLYSHLLLGEVYILITVDMLKWILLIRWKMF